MVCLSFLCFKYSAGVDGFFICMTKDQAEKISRDNSVVYKLNIESSKSSQSIVSLGDELQPRVIRYGISDPVKQFAPETRQITSSTTVVGGRKLTEESISHKEDGSIAQSLNPTDISCVYNFSSVEDLPRDVSYSDMCNNSRNIAIPSNVPKAPTMISSSDVIAFTPPVPNPLNSDYALLSIEAEIEEQRKLAEERRKEEESQLASERMRRRYRERYMKRRSLALCPRSIVRPPAELLNRHQHFDWNERYNEDQGPAFNAWVGSSLCNKYFVRGMLGAGTFGNVYEGWNHSYGPVAVKIVRGEQKLSSAALEESAAIEQIRQLERSAGYEWPVSRVVWLMDTLAISALYNNHGEPLRTSYTYQTDDNGAEYRHYKEPGYVEHRGEIWNRFQHHVMVMERLGPSLHSFLAMNNRAGMMLSDLRLLTADLLEGIHFLHSHNVIHGDLKVHNLALELGCFTQGDHPRLRRKKRDPRSKEGKYRHGQRKHLARLEDIVKADGLLGMNLEDRTTYYKVSHTATQQSITACNELISEQQRIIEIADSTNTNLTKEEKKRLKKKKYRQNKKNKKNGTASNDNDTTSPNCDLLDDEMWFDALEREEMAKGPHYASEEDLWEPVSVLRPLAPRLRIIDMGNATFLSADEQPNFIISTRQYRAPEVALGCVWNVKADVWSVGCIIYELLTGKELFPAYDNDIEHLAILEKVLGQPTPSHLIECAGEEQKTYFDENGKLRWPELAPSNSAIRRVDAAIPLGKLWENLDEEEEHEKLTKRINACLQLKMACSPEDAIAELYKVISGLCSFDPRERLSAGDVLQMPFYHLTEIREPTSLWKGGACAEELAQRFHREELADNAPAHHGDLHTYTQRMKQEAKRKSQLERGEMCNDDDETNDQISNDEDEAVEDSDFFDDEMDEEEEDVDVSGSSSMHESELYDDEDENYDDDDEEEEEIEDDIESEIESESSESCETGLILQRNIEYQSDNDSFHSLDDHLHNHNDIKNENATDHYNDVNVSDIGSSHDEINISPAAATCSPHEFSRSASNFDEGLSDMSQLNENDSNIPPQIVNGSTESLSKGAPLLSVYGTEEMTSKTLNCLKLLNLKKKLISSNASTQPTETGGSADLAASFNNAPQFTN